MRVTESMKLASVTHATARATERWSAATRRAGTGLRVERPSDDPVAFAVTTVQKGDIDRLARRATTLGRAAGDLDAAEGALAGASDLMVRARELAVQMADGSMTAAERAGAAKEVVGLRQSLIGLANAPGARGYLFAGSATDTPPFDAGGAFLGNDKALGVEVADGLVTRANASGRDAFTALGGGRDVLQDLADLATALGANDQPAVANAIGILDQDHRQIVGARVDTGLRAERLRAAGRLATAAAGVVESARADLGELDGVAAYSELAAAEQALGRSLEITRRILAQSADVLK